MKKISIIGATIIGNRGAEAMLTTVIGRCREKFAQSHFYIYSYYPREDKKLVKDPGITIHSATPFAITFVVCPFSAILAVLCFLRLSFLRHLFPAPVRHLAESNVLIDIPGVSFVDGREKFLPYNVLTILPAFLLGVPVYKFAQALGPFNNKINRLLAKPCLKRCSRIFARGSSTLENLGELGIPADIYALAPDIVFSRKRDDSLSKENEANVDEMSGVLQKWKKEERRIIGICPSSLVAGKFKRSGADYFAFLKTVIDGIIRKSHRVVLFPNATRGEHIGKMRNNDLAVIRPLASHLGRSDEVVAVQVDITADSIKSLVEQCDITVVSRFHAMVTSLESAVPSMVLGWGHKYQEVMEQFDQGQWVLDYSESSTHLVLHYIFMLLANRDMAKEHIRRNLDRVKSESFAQFESLFNKLDETQ